MIFARPELLWLAAALPLLVLLGLTLYSRRRRRVVRSLGDAELVRRLGAGDLARFPVARLLLLVPAAAALGLAAADPRWGAESVESHGSSFNVALAVDVSKSMWARDVSPDRLERERQLAHLLLRELPTDRFGVVVFAGRAYVLTPLTVDHGALELYVDALDPEMVSQGGTSLASAIRQATGLVVSDPRVKGDRAVVLMTDGEALEEQADVLDAARTAASAGVRIFAAGVGTVEGGTVPEDPSAANGVWKRDLDGNIVVSHLNEPLLQQVAQITQGQYVRMADPGATSRLVADLRSMRRAPGAEGRRVEQKEQYGWFIGLALLFLALDAILARRAVLRAEEVTESQAVSAGLPRPDAAGATSATEAA